MRVSEDAYVVLKTVARESDLPIARVLDYAVFHLPPRLEVSRARKDSRTCSTNN